MRSLIVVVLLMMFSSCAIFQKKTIKHNASQEFIGAIRQNQLLETPCKKWFADRFMSYKLNDSLKRALKSNFTGVKIKAFVGLWCSDSKRELPILLKILQEIDVPKSNIELIAVDYKKKAKGLEKGYSISRVPTFIFYKKNEELGRFVEFPQQSLEADILDIVSGKPYKHFYEN